MPAADRDLYRSEPVWSMIRLGFDLTPNVVPVSILTGPFAAQAQADKVLFAFSYGISDTDAVKAGFGTGTKPRRDHTCLDRAGIVPQGGEMEIEAIALEPMMITTPVFARNTIPTPDQLVSDLIGAQRMTADWLGAESATGKGAGSKELRSLLLDLCNRALVPFWSYGEGEKRNYLPGMTELPSHGKVADEGGHGIFSGSPLILPERVPWTNSGDTREFRVGFEIRQEQKQVSLPGAPIVAPATGTYELVHGIAAALGVNWNGATPPGELDDPVWFACLDIKVILHGVRREIQKAGL